MSIMIPSTPALFSTYKLAFIAFLLFAALFIVTLSNGIITERSALVSTRVTERSARSSGESFDVVHDAQRDAVSKKV
nr:hypothetical protein CFP56_62419 [Quercus suber]